MVRHDRRTLLAGAAAGAGTFVLAGAHDASAKSPKVGEQAPGIHRLSVGDVEITALLDGYIDLDIGLLPRADPAEVKRLQRARFLPETSSIRGAVNCYVINTGDRTILVDTGGRDLLGPTLGHVHANLTAAGMNAPEIDQVFLTHLHPDHIGGLTDGEGSASFENADIIIHETEWSFWTSEQMMKDAPESARRFFTLAKEALAPYADRIRRLEGKDTEITPEITTLDLSGHTPGHTGLRIESGGDQLLILGDIVHMAALQFPRPDWAIAFDYDPDQAISARKRTLDMVAADRLMVCGMHIPFPGVGHVVKRGTGYGFVPVEWQYRVK